MSTSSTTPSTEKLKHIQTIDGRPTHPLYHATRKVDTSGLTYLKPKPTWRSFFSRIHGLVSIICVLAFVLVLCLGITELVLRAHLQSDGCLHEGNISSTLDPSCEGVEGAENILSWFTVGAITLLGTGLLALGPGHHGPTQVFILLTGATLIATAIAQGLTVSARQTLESACGRKGAYKGSACKAAQKTYTLHNDISTNIGYRAAFLAIGTIILLLFLPSHTTDVGRLLRNLPVHKTT